MQFRYRAEEKTVIKEMEEEIILCVCTVVCVCVCVHYHMQLYFRCSFCSAAYVILNANTAVYVQK